VLRLVLELTAKSSRAGRPHIGLASPRHRKADQHKTYLQAIPYFDG